MFDWMKTALEHIISVFFNKNTAFGNALLAEESEHFDIIHLLKFRKYYHLLFRELASLFNLAAAEQKENKPLRGKK